MLSCGPEELVSDRESFFDQFDEAGVDFSLGAIPNDEALALAGAPHLRFDRQDNGVEIGRGLPPWVRTSAKASARQRGGAKLGQFACVPQSLRAAIAVSESCGIWSCFTASTIG